MIKVATALSSALLVLGTLSVLAAEQPDSPVPDPRACVELRAAIESLKTMLAREAQARDADRETQRAQLVVALLGLRYRNIEGLESALRGVDSEELDLRTAAMRVESQLGALDEALRAGSAAAQEADLKLQRSALEGELKAIEERAKGLRDRRGSFAGQITAERADIAKLEALVRGWLEKAP